MLDGIAMRRSLALMLALCSPAVVLAQEPVFDTWTAIPDAEMPSAYYKMEEGYEAGFGCNDLGGLVFTYAVWDELLDPAVAGLPEVDVVFATDQPGTIEDKSWVALEPEVSGGFAVFSFTGDAVDWARDAMKAKRTIQIGLSPHAEGAGFKLYNSMTLSAAGSTAAIRPVMDRCG